MELVDLYDDDKNLTGEKMARGDVMPDGRYRLSVHMWIVNSIGQVYIQKRAGVRRLFPNLWENPGGGVLSGQDSKSTMIREFEEELGISPDVANAKIIATIKRTKDLVDIWLIKQDFKMGELELQESEVAEAKWVSIYEIKDMIAQGKFCPTIMDSFNPFMEYMQSDNAK